MKAATPWLIGVITSIGRTMPTVPIGLIMPIGLIIPITIITAGGGEINRPHEVVAEK